MWEKREVNYGEIVYSYSILIQTMFHTHNVVKMFIAGRSCADLKSTS